jgi:hypothetical protein
MNWVSGRDQPIAEARFSLKLGLVMVANFGLYYDGPSVCLFDEDIGPPALLEYPPNVFGAKCPLAAEPVKNFAESGVDCLFVCTRRHC